MLRAIAYGFRNLLNLEGRDRRRVFWPYAIIVALLAYFAAIGLMLLTRESVEHEFHVVAAEFKPRVWFAFAGSIMTPFLAMFFGLFSACVRRLHDSGASMRTAVIVFGSLTVCYLMFLPLPILVGAGNSAASGKAGLLPLAYFFVMLGFGFVANFGLFWLLYLLLRRGTPGDNRYGPPPPKKKGLE